MLRCSVWFRTYVKPRMATAYKLAFISSSHRQVFRWRLLVKCVQFHGHFAVGDALQILPQRQSIAVRQVLLQASSQVHRFANVQVT